MIEVRDLSKSFGAHLILERVNFRIETGESVVIIGRSGGGKSVLLKHLVGLLKPTSGQVLIEGENSPVTWVPIEEICSLEWSIGGPAQTTGVVPAFAAGKQ